MDKNALMYFTKRTLDDDDDDDDDDELRDSVV